MSPFLKPGKLDIFDRVLHTGQGKQLKSLRELAFKMCPTWLMVCRR
jgi:hypothetical protein